LNNKKNPQKLIKEIASCKVKYGILVSNSKKVAKLICLGGKEYGNVITVIQMCKKAKGITCTSKHILDKMWKQWQVKGGKERGKENSDDKEETSLVKADDKTKGKKKKGDNDTKTETTCACNHCQKKGHIEANFWQLDPSKMPKHLWKKKDAKTKKATAAVEEEHLLSVVDVETENKVEYEFHNNAAARFKCLDLYDAYIKAKVVEDNAFVQNELELEEEDVENEDKPNDFNQIRPMLQALSSPNM
jgi:hypothetical protein